MIFIIHVQYSNNFEEDSVRRLITFSSEIYQNSFVKLIIVENDLFSFNKLENRSKKTYSEYSIEYIRGSNLYNEFSGYQEGIDYVRSVYSFNPNSLIIFSNDTFYRHRYFDGLLRHMFLKKINESIKSNYNKPFIIGFNEINQENNCIINGLKIDSHLSTFFFVINHQFLSIIPNILNITVNTNKVHLNNRLFNIQNANHQYVKKITNWLFIPSDNSWYKAKKINLLDNLEIQSFTKKIYCICNEHVLTALSKFNQIKIISVYEEHFLNPYLYIRFFENKLIKLLLKFNLFNFLRK
jgi:hypothetical protein